MATNKAAKVVTSELLGLNIEAFTINGKQYSVSPPTMKTLTKALFYFSDIDMDGTNFKDIISSVPTITGSLAKGLSCFVKGDITLADEFGNGTVEEIKVALNKCFSMIDTSVFQCASLAKSMTAIAARQRL